MVVKVSGALIKTAICFERLLEDFTTFILSPLYGVILKRITMDFFISKVKNVIKQIILILLVIPSFDYIYI